MTIDQIKKAFEAEAKDMNAYVTSVLSGYTQQGIRPAAEVTEAAKLQYILAMINQLKGAKNVEQTTAKKPIRRKKASAVSAVREL